MTVKLLNGVSRFCSIVLVTTFLTRIYVLTLFYIFGRFVSENSPIVKQIVEDPWHHYHVGLLLVVFGVIFFKIRKSTVLLAVGLGIFLEEWAVFLNDFGFRTKYLYASKIDFFIIMFLVGFVYLSTKLLSRRQSYKYKS